MWLMTNTLMALLLLLAIASAAEDTKLSSHAATMAEQSANLAFNLYHTVAKEKDLDNILISPVVVASSLGMVALGGKSSTTSQVRESPRRPLSLHSNDSFETQP